MQKKLSLDKEKIRILLLEGIHQSAVDTFHANGYTNIEHHKVALLGDELLQGIKSAHVIGVRSRTQLTAHVLEQADNLLAIGAFCIGTNQIDLGVAAANAVPVFNSPHSNTRSVAEMVLAESVMLVRGLGDKNMACHKGAWTKSAVGSNELRGKVMGIVGYGHIGSQVSILAEAFGMSVLYYDVVSKLAMGNAQQVGTLEELLSRADIITLHVPQAADTVNLMSAEAQTHLKQGACLINASRGTVVDIEALSESLKAGRLSGAAIDVFPKEPKSNDEVFDSPLRGLKNVILTPHIGGSTQEAQRNIGVEVASKIIQYSDLGSTAGAVNFPNISLAPQKKAHRLLHAHKNQPGVIVEINRVLASSEANILGQFLGTTNELGYVVVDVDSAYQEGLREKLQAIPGTLRCRILY